MIVLENISFAYGKKPLFNRLNLSIAQQKITCILGDSGSGKTTLLRLIAGLEQADSGSISIDNRLVSKDAKSLVPISQRNIGFVFQDLALWPHLTVFENISFGLKERKIPEIEQKVTEILDFFDILEQIYKFPHQLSGGQKQLVAIARSLILQPKILLMDEPLANLDIKRKKNLLEHIKRLPKEFDTSIIYITHDHSEAMNIADQIVIIDEGKVRYADS
jgi:ABC-type sugar transport system ATPase subunit